MCCAHRGSQLLGVVPSHVAMDQPRVLCLKPPIPPPASPWLANSKRHWLWLARKYEERLIIYKNDYDKVKLIEELQKTLAEEKSRRKKAEEKVQRYEHAHKRVLNFVVGEFVLPPPPSQPELGSKDAPICVPDTEETTRPGGGTPQKRVRVSLSVRPKVVAA